MPVQSVEDIYQKMQKITQDNPSLGKFSVTVVRDGEVRDLSVPFMEVPKRPLAPPARSCPPLGSMNYSLPGFTGTIGDLFCLFGG